MMNFDLRTDVSFLRKLKREIVERIKFHSEELNAAFKNYERILNYNPDEYVSGIEYQKVNALYKELNETLTNHLKNVNLICDKAVAASAEIRFLSKELDFLVNKGKSESTGFQKLEGHCQKRIVEYREYIERLGFIKIDLEVLFKTDGGNVLGKYVEDLRKERLKSEVSMLRIGEKRKHSSVKIDQEEFYGPVRTKGARKEVIPTPPSSPSALEPNVPSPIEVEDTSMESRTGTSSVIEIEDSSTSSSSESEEDFTENIFLLPNGLKSPVYRYNNRPLLIKNTCGFDSIAQIFLTAIVDYRNYRSKLEKSKSKSIRFLLKLLKKGDVSQAVEWRDHYLMYYGNSKIKEDNAGNMELDLFGALSKIWKTYYSSIFVGHYKFDCHPNVSKPKHFLSIVGDGIQEKDEEMRRIKMKSYISDKLNALMQTDKAKCTECGSKNFRLELEDQLYIEILNNNPNCTLEFFQSSLNFLGKKFRLVGVVDYISNHFVAYVRRIDGSWEVHDDLKQNIVEISNLNFKIRPEAAIYIKE